MHDWANEPLQYIEPGMQIKLVHIASEKKLHSHDVRPPISDVDFQNEVSGYGHAGFPGDSNDNWMVEIDHGDRRDRESGKRLRTLRTIFKLRHIYQGCYLFSHKMKLPEWGFEQQEVTCNKNAVRDNSLWFIETNTHPARKHDPFCRLQILSFTIFSWTWLSESQLSPARICCQILGITAGHVDHKCRLN